VHISSLLYITSNAFIASHKVCSTRRLFACTKASLSAKAMPHFSTKQFLESVPNVSVNIFFHFLCHVSAAGMNFALLGLSSVRKPSSTHPSQQHIKANSFRDIATKFARPQYVMFLSMETLKTLVYTAPSKIKRHFTNAFFKSVTPFPTVLGPLKGCDSPWPNVGQDCFDSGRGYFDNLLINVVWKTTRNQGY